MSVNKVVSTQFIAQIKKGKRVLNVAYVDKTELWRRPIISDEMKKQFIAIAEENIESCNKSTETVAFQETPHESPRDPATHYTVVEMNDSNEVIAKKHYRVKK